MHDHAHASLEKIVLTGFKSKIVQDFIFLVEMDPKCENTENTKDKGNSVICDICRHKREVNTATNICIICRFLFCTNCAESHKELPNTKDHLLIHFDVSETSNPSFLSILDSVKNAKVETDTVDSDFIYLEEKTDIPSSAENISGPLLDDIWDKDIEAGQSPRVITLRESIRKFISLPDDHLIVQLSTTIFVLSKDFRILTEIDCPRNGHLVQTSGKGFSIVTPTTIIEVSISYQKVMKITNVLSVKSELPASILDVSYDDDVYFIITIGKKEDKGVLETKPSSVSKEKVDDTKHAQSLHLYALFKGGNLIRHSQPMLGYTSDLKDGTIYSATAKRRVYISNDDGIFCTSMYGEVVAHFPPFKRMVENPYALVSAICVDDDTIYQVVNEELPESSICNLHTVQTTTKETKKYKLDSSFGLNNGKRLGAMAVQRSMHRVVLQNGDKIEVFHFGDETTST